MRPRRGKRRAGDANDVVQRFLPAEFVARIPRADRAWRGRTILLLWALGYPLEMAWWLGMSDDLEQCRFYRAAIAKVDDPRLVATLRNFDISRRGWPTSSGT